MTQENKNEEENMQESSQEWEVQELQKPAIPVQKVSRTPSFPNAHQFGKGSFNNFNNKQRPGRAAARGR